MEDKRKFIIYLDQNILSNLREGEPARDELLRTLKHYQKHEPIFVYSQVHVEECRAFHDPDQFVRVIDEIKGFYIQPSERFEHNFEISPNRAKDLMLSKPDLASKAQEYISELLVLAQYVVGWLGKLESKELQQELEKSIDLLVPELQRETFGLLDVVSFRQILLESLRSIDLDKHKSDALHQQPQTTCEWNERFNQIDNLASDNVVEFIFSELGDEAKRRLIDTFPQKNWPNGPYANNGALVGLTFLLFTQGVGRDPKVKKGNQSTRRKRFRAQFRDCRHIEEAARCDLFLSNDSGAIKLAQAAYAYAGVSTEARVL
ncbi:hypothetical protein SAMN04488518_1356 [Pseudovibrio ascidiaceicola]|uniref:DUF4935 domain-containing protein n=1 Tax=Pseudovibrio ascidiaceicola TaxID=285279 RepID=A0A1I4GBJ0_9HYPH|nr:hypothetical protein [Pseudovibrio ascidiaceicola]SFL26521.1 hypothetical protein SAMN04488518_1356 [Pseudovibrio ascidiaceicola]